MFYVFPRAVPKSECRKLLKYCIKNTKFQEASVINKGFTDSDPQEVVHMSDDRSRSDPKIRKTDVAFIEDRDNRVNEVAWFYLREANKIQFNYDLEHFEAVQFAEYREGDFFDWHQDTSGIKQSNEIRKLSLTLVLSDPDTFEGGELQFYNGGRPIQDMGEITADQIKSDIKAQWTIIVFDSQDWHRVWPPVKNGVRHSIVCWTVGPDFK